MDSDSASVRLGSSEKREEPNVPLVRPTGGMVMVCLEELEKVNPFLDEFCDSYLSFHGIKSRNEIFRHLPLLSCVECLVRQIMRVADAEKPSFLLNGCFVRAADPYNALTCLLDNKLLLTNEIREEICLANKDWLFIRQLYNKMAKNKKISVRNAKRAMNVRSFNVRILNRVLYNLGENEVNPNHMKFFNISGILSGICDDLCNYEEDVFDGNMNILRVFVKVYGPLEASMKLVQHIQRLERSLRKCQTLLEPELSAYLDQQLASAGRWSIPTIITDEDSYRARFRS